MLPPAPVEGSARRLTREAVQAAHKIVRPYVHETPVLTCDTISEQASRPLKDGNTGPRINLFFKCENFQKIGAFKYRGATHALANIPHEELKQRGVITHSSGNHAQALALAARVRGIQANIVMPQISAPSKIEATKAYGANVIFSGSTSQEREAVVEQVMAEKGSILVPPYDNENIILGQGTMALEAETQVNQLLGDKGGGVDAMVAPLGGGGMLSGIATAMSGTNTLVFGTEPSYQGADDGRRSLLTDSPKRIERVSSLTIADGLRTPLSDLTFSVVSDKDKVAGLFEVTESEIIQAMRLCIERLKVWVEPSAAVGLAAVLYNEQFRQGLLQREKRLQEEWSAQNGGDSEESRKQWQGWNIVVILCGGNTTIEAVAKIFADDVAKSETSANGVS